MKPTIKRFELFLKFSRLNATTQKASNTKSFFLLTITTPVNL